MPSTITIKNFRQSSSFFMATLCSILLLTVVAFVFYFINLVNSDSFLDESRAAIDAQMEKLLLLEQIDPNLLKNHLAMQKQSADEAFVFALISKDKSLLIGEATFWSSLLGQLSNQPHILTQHQMSSEDYLLVNDPFQRLEHLTLADNYLSRVVQLGTGDYIVVARNIDEFRTARWVAMTFGWVILLITLVLIVCFYVIGQFVVRKVNAISDIANEIVSTGNISKRIALDWQWDDLSKLEIVLNRLLDQIESLMLGMKKVTDDIAHDLKTPLTRLRNDLESVEPEDLKLELLKEADLLLAMFNGLLRIAEIESGRKRSAFEWVQFDEVVSDAEAFYLPLAEEKNISLNSVIPPLILWGDRNLLFQMCVNLLDNAVKYTAKGGSIHLSIADKNNTIILTVCDTGCGISPSEATHIFKRLYRVESSRQSEGNGLGLAIVEAIVNLHQGTIEVSSLAQGTCFTIKLPMNV